MPAKGQFVGEVTRFEAKVRKTPGCWEWTAATTGTYGAFTLNGNRKQVRAHRYAYELWRGPIPAGLHIDHLCRNPLCVNPDHLEPVTCRENLLRGETSNAANLAKTHCKRGHAFDELNTLHLKSGARVCRVCNRARQREFYLRKQSAT